jgi:hypothetical protein
VKQIIGKVMAVASLVAGATIVTAGPSSALPRDVCMDQLHYWQKVSWYEDHAADAAEILYAWQDASFTTNAGGASVWNVNLPTGTVVVTSFFDYAWGTQKAQAGFQTALNAELSFINATTVCM